MARHDDDEGSKKRKRKEKDKDRKKSKKRTKKKKFDHSERRDRAEKKQSKKRSRAESSVSDSSSGSDSEGPVGSSVEERLARGRQAVQLTRALVARWPALRGEFRDLLEKLDGGEGVRADGVADRELQQLLVALLSNLELHCRAGVYSRRDSKGPMLVSMLAPVLSEEADPALASMPLEALLRTAQLDKPQPASPAGYDGVTATTSASAEGCETMDDREPIRELERESASIAAVGGAMTTGDDNVGDGNSELGTAVPAVVGPSEGPPTKRRAGPMMPPPEILAAAAALGPGAYSDSDEDPEDFNMIGPPPPEIVVEDNLSTEESRLNEVKRIIQAKAAEVDAYMLMGLEPTSDSKMIKKKYWQLSLKIHPDKCPHPQAKDAFDAVLQAHKTLQDPAKRAALDETRERVEVERVARQLMVQQREAAVWRKTRGQKPLPGDEDLLKMGQDGAPPEEEGRGTWMTELPPDRAPAAQPKQVNVTNFAMRTVTQRGDTSSWTDTPEQARARQALLGYSTTLALEEAETQRATVQASATAAVVDTYNQRSRPKTLMEMHQEKQAKATKDAKKAGKAKKEEWEGQHPWKPWDREKDLVIKPKGKKEADLKHTHGNLSDRFGGSGGGRSFL